MPERKRFFFIDVFPNSNHPDSRVKAKYYYLPFILYHQEEGLGVDTGQVRLLTTFVQTMPFGPIMGSGHPSLPNPN